jgi:hypothetical protein
MKKVCHEFHELALILIVCLKLKNPISRILIREIGFFELVIKPSY